MATIDAADLERQQPAVGELRIAGFWRRSFAALLDSLLLGTIGMVMGLLWFDRLAALGSAGRWLGAWIALGYLGVLSSRLGRGQTLGDRMLGIRVVDAGGAAIGVSRAVLRAVVLLLPVALNGIDWPLPEDGLLMPALPAVCIAGLGGASVYLYVFNRRTRQALHDLATGTFVVEAGEAGVVRARIWPAHLVLAAGWLVAVATGTGPFVRHLADAYPMQNLRELQHAAQDAVPGTHAGVMRGRSFGTFGGRQSSTQFLHVTILTPQKPTSEEGLADRVATALLLSNADFHDVDRLAVTVRYGFDILIANAHSSNTFAHTPDEWRERLHLGRAA
jgi:uncharacterized RDD family membrane protein YckC